MSSSRRRYEITHRGKRRFWEISRQGRRVTATYGPVDSPGQSHNWTHESETAAASDMNRRARKKLEAGFVLVDSEDSVEREPPPVQSNPELEAAIAADFDAIEPYLVYADWLTDHGDPRGELITMQCHQEGETDTTRFLELQERVRAVQREHPSVMGLLADHLPEISIHWRRGYIDRLVIRHRADTRLCVVALAKTPIAAMLRDLGIEDLADETATELAADTFAHLTSLSLRGFSFGARPELALELIDQILMLEFAPKLRRLETSWHGSKRDLCVRIIDSPLATQLEKLNIRNNSNAGRDVLTRARESGRLPMLER